VGRTRLCADNDVPVFDTKIAHPQFEQLLKDDLAAAAIGGLATYDLYDSPVSPSTSNRQPGLAFVPGVTLAFSWGNSDGGAR
jgi:hypothetical protein